MAAQVIAFSKTEVSAEKTALEIEDMLRKHGCEKIGKTFESGRIKAIYFQIATSDATMPFTLPVNVEPIYQMLYDKRRGSAQFPWGGQELKVLEQRLHDQAERTAWRIIWHWLKAQLALIQTQMVNVAQVFLAYMLVSENETLYQNLSAGGFKALMPSRMNDGE